MLQCDPSRVIGAVVVAACLAAGCLPPVGHTPARFVAFLGENGLTFEPGTPPPDAIGASDVMRFPGQTASPIYGAVSCHRPPCPDIVARPGQPTAVWLVVFPGPLADDGLGWALIDANGDAVIASSK